MTSRSKIRQRADELFRRGQQRKARAIDTAMENAAELFEIRKRQEDPYAMHKAVESLPVEVLIEVLSKKVTWSDQ